MEVAVNVEDDLSFADLSKQIALLIMDEDEDPALACCSEVSLDVQAFSRPVHPPSQSYSLYDQANYRRGSKGTGVFIPQSTQPRRKIRQGRSYGYNRKSQRQSEDTRMTMSRVSDGYSLKP